MQLHLDDLEQALIITKEFGMGAASTALESAIDNCKHYMEKETLQIKKAVDDTIDAYKYYVESPHNPPPMNGSDYYNLNYK